MYEEPRAFHAGGWRAALYEAEAGAVEALLPLSRLSRAFRLSDMLMRAMPQMAFTTL